MKHFVKYKNWWWEYNPNFPPNCTTLYNAAGGRCSDVNIVGLETTVAESLSNLNWEGTEVLNPKFKTGWLSPDGCFFGCENRCHLSQARYVHKKTEEQLENEGWVKICYTIYYNKNGTRNLQAIFYAEDDIIYPTNEQLNYVRNNYAGEEKSNILNYLLRTRKMRQEKIKQDWGVEK